MLIGNLVTPLLITFLKQKKYYDYRKMYDEMGKSVGAVMVATFDHTHAIIAASAINMDKYGMWKNYCSVAFTHFGICTGID